MLVQHIEDGPGESPEEEERGNQYERHQVVGAVRPKQSVFVFQFSIFNFQFPIYYFSVSISFQIPAAQAPPTNGPTMKIHRLASAVPPWNTAGAIERAGFTEVPV